MKIDRERLVAVARGHRTMETLRPDTDRSAAVLIPVVERDGRMQILFEVRASSVPQGGEICFPGGAVEPGETPEQAAVRETTEELLIEERQITVVAPLFEMAGPGGTWISSYLGELKGYADTRSEDEVDRTFLLPISELAQMEPVISHLSLKVDETEEFPYELIPGGRAYPLRRLPRAYYFYKTEHGVIWGMTAELLYHTLRLWKEV